MLLKIRVSMVRLTRAIHGARPSGALRASKSAILLIYCIASRLRRPVRLWPPRGLHFIPGRLIDRGRGYSVSHKFFRIRTRFLLYCGNDHPPARTERCLQDNMQVTASAAQLRCPQAVRCSPWVIATVRIAARGVLARSTPSHRGNAMRSKSPRARVRSLILR